MVSRTYEVLHSHKVTKRGWRLVGNKSLIMHMIAQEEDTHK